MITDQETNHEIIKLKSEILTLKNEINKQRNINKEIRQRFQLISDEINNIKEVLNLE